MTKTIGDYVSQENIFALMKNTAPIKYWKTGQAEELCKVFKKQAQAIASLPIPQIEEDDDGCIHNCQEVAVLRKDIIELIKENSIFKENLANMIKGFRPHSKLVPLCEEEVYDFISQLNLSDCIDEDGFISPKTAKMIAISIKQLFATPQIDESRLRGVLKSFAYSAIEHNPKDLSEIRVNKSALDQALSKIIEEVENK